MVKVPYGEGIKIYNKSPIWFKNIFGICTKPISRSAMLGRGFNDFFIELEKTQWLNTDELKKYQEKKLRALIKHAYINVPYYHRKFREENLNYEDIKTIEDLKKIPTMTKDDIRANFKDLTAFNASDYSYGVGHTTGSTGEPLSFLLDQQNREMEYATVWRQLKWAGIGIDAKIATFRGDFVNEADNKFALWKYNGLSKELIFNSYNMNNKTIHQFIEKLQRYKPDLIKGYPSSLYLIARYMKNQEIDLVKPLAIQTSSELLTKSQRELIQEQFKCEIFDWYGHSEYAISAGECECHDGHHVNVESGIIELLYNEEIVGIGELGEITATGLYNYSMPIIRYSTSDIGRYSDEICNCGRGLPILKSLEGRVSDIIISPDGKMISGMAFEHYWKHKISPCTPNIEYVHVIQQAKNKLLVQMVKNHDYSDKETESIIQELTALLGTEMHVHMTTLDVVPTGQKWRFTESEIVNQFTN